MDKECFRQARDKVLNKEKLSSGGIGTLARRRCIQS